MNLYHPFTLDHLYITLNHESFDSIKSKMIELYGATLKIYTSPLADKSWEGIYIFTNEGTYLEVLKASDQYGHGQVGIALSHRDQTFDTIGFCKENLPNISMEETLTSTAEPWFTSIFKSSTSLKPKAFVWIMAYQGAYITSRFAKKDSAKLQNFNQIKLFTSKEVLLELESYQDWLPQTSIYSITEVSHPDSYGFEIS